MGCLTFSQVFNCGQVQLAVKLKGSQEQETRISTRIHSSEVLPTVLPWLKAPELTLPVGQTEWSSDTSRAWSSPVWARQRPAEPWHCNLFVQVFVHSALLTWKRQSSRNMLQSLLAMLVTLCWFCIVLFYCVQRCAGS